MCRKKEKRTSFAQLMVDSGYSWVTRSMTAGTREPSKSERERDELPQERVSYNAKYRANGYKTGSCKSPVACEEKKDRRRRRPPLGGAVREKKRRLEEDGEDWEETLSDALDEEDRLERAAERVPRGRTRARQTLGLDDDVDDSQVLRAIRMEAREVKKQESSLERRRKEKEEAQAAAAEEREESMDDSSDEFDARSMGRRFRLGY